MDAKLFWKVVSSPKKELFEITLKTGQRLDCVRSVQQCRDSFGHFEVIHWEAFTPIKTTYLHAEDVETVTF